MAITEEQRLARKKGIGSSDAKKIVDGDWLDLWNDKTGTKEWEPNVQQQFAMDCGTALEPVILNRLAFRFQSHIAGDPPTAHRQFDNVQLISHADGHIPDSQGRNVELIGVEVKAHGGFKDIDELIEFYMPQLQHHMIVHDRKQWMFAVCFGQFWRFDYQLVARDDLWCESYVEQCKEFWAHVETGFAPMDDGAKKAAKQIIAKKAVDFTGHNQWAAFSDDFLECEEAHATFDTAKAALKELMPDDTSYAWGHGMQIKRAKNGALTIKLEVQKDRDAVDNYETVIKHNEV